MRIDLFLISIFCSACSAVNEYGFVQLTGNTPDCRYVKAAPNDSFQYKYECGSVDEKEVLLYSRRLQRTSNWLFNKKVVMGYPSDNEYSSFKINRFEIAFYKDTRVYFRAGGLLQSGVVFYLEGYESDSVDTEIKIWGVYQGKCPKTRVLENTLD